MQVLACASAGVLVAIAGVLLRSQVLLSSARSPNFDKKDPSVESDGISSDLLPIILLLIGLLAAPTAIAILFGIFAHSKFKKAAQQVQENVMKAAALAQESALKAAAIMQEGAHMAVEATNSVANAARRTSIGSAGESFLSSGGALLKNTAQKLSIISEFASSTSSSQSASADDIVASSSNLPGIERRQQHATSANVSELPFVIVESFEPISATTEILHVQFPIHQNRIDPLQRALKHSNDLGAVSSLAAEMSLLLNEGIPSANSRNVPSLLDDGSANDGAVGRSDFEMSSILRLRRAQTLAYSQYNSSANRLQDDQPTASYTPRTNVHDVPLSSASQPQAPSGSQSSSFLRTTAAGQNKLLPQYVVGNQPVTQVLPQKFQAQSVPRKQMSDTEAFEVEC
jgi:hypothetical protein